MSSHNPDKSPLIKRVYKRTFQDLKDTPVIFIPFLIFSIIELLALIILFLAPRMPLRLIMGPPIRTFWGERFLHYPINFLLLPKMASFSRMALSVFLSSLLTGMAVAMVSAVYNKRHARLKEAFKSGLKRYISLFAVVLIFTGLFYFLHKLIFISLARYFIAGHTKLLFLKPQIWLGPILAAINFLLGLLIQSAFIYAIPLLMIEKERLIKSVIKSFVLFKKLFVPTILLVGLPMIIYIPLIVINYNTSFLIYKVFPESVLLGLILGIIVTSLVIDPLITVATTVLYLMSRET